MKTLKTASLAFMLAVLVTLSATVWATPVRADLEETLDAIRAEFSLPAMGVVLFDRDGVLELAVAGTRRVGGTDPVQPGDQWHMGSLTKAMTATVAARLAARGLIGLDSTVGGILAESFPDLHEGHRTTTLAQLLSHTGGIDDAALDAGTLLILFRQDRDTAEHRRYLVGKVLAAPPAAEAGSGFEYSNNGYVIAGAMLEAASGKSWEALMKRELFEPLGMERAGFGAPGPDGQAPLGHLPGGDRPIAVPPSPFADNPPAIGPAGTVHASLEDFARYLAVHLGPGEFLDEAMLAELHRPMPAADGYALGWGVLEREWAGGTALTHLGSNNRWFAVVWLAPARGFGVLAVTNSAQPGAPEALDRAVSALIQSHLKE